MKLNLLISLLNFSGPGFRQSLVEKSISFSLKLLNAFAHYTDEFPLFWAEEISRVSIGGTRYDNECGIVHSSLFVRIEVRCIAVRSGLPRCYFDCFIALNYSLTFIGDKYNTT